MFFLCSYFFMFSSFYSIQLKQLEKPKKKNTHVMQQHQYKTTGGSFNIKVVMLISPKSAFRIGQVSTAHKSWNARLGCNWLFNPILPQTVLYAQQRRRTRWKGQVHGNTEHEPWFGSRLLGRKQTFVRSRRVQSWPIGKTGEGEEEAECLHSLLSLLLQRYFTQSYRHARWWWDRTRQH